MKMGFCFLIGATIFLFLFFFGGGYRLVECLSADALQGLKVTSKSFRTFSLS